MRFLGVVHWTNRDKGGIPIAGVRPLVELQKTEWRSIDASEEFPSQGQAFWWNAHAAMEGALIFFSTEPNPGQKDEFRVVEPKPAHEILDLRGVGSEREVLAALERGIRGPDYLSASRVMVWCGSDVLIGPVDLVCAATGTLKLNGVNLARVPMYVCDSTQVRSVSLDRSTRLLRGEDAPPTAYVDWDNDTTVLRRALDAAVRVAKLMGRTGQTKKQIEDAARDLAEQGAGPDAKLDLYRVERALSLLKNTDAVVRSAGDLAKLLLEHPAVKLSLDAAAAKVREDVEQSARAAIEQELARERAALSETNEARKRAKLELDANERDLLKIKGQVTAARESAETAAKEADAAVEARVLVAIERPMDLLAEVGVLRPFFRSGGIVAANAKASPVPSKLNWSRTRGEDFKDKASFRRHLTGAARAQGVDPSLMLHVHAAVVARLMPMTLGPSAFAALVAYAQAACGGRLLIIHVSPSAVQPNDFDELPAGGLLAAATAAKDIDGLSVVILEGANRAPLEASVVPLLQLTEVGLSSLAISGGLRLSASLVAGATTVPVTPQIWSHAAAIYPDPSSPSAQNGTLGDLVLSNDLLAPGEEPKGAIDTLLDAWPDCRDLHPAMSRFGSALARLYDDSPRISEALLHSIVLPYVATAFSVEEQTETLAKVGDADGAIARALRRLRKRLA
jgi:hypothetical protein